jgi:hypothetical protein
MKKLLILSLITLASSLAFSQTNDVEKLLLKKFTASEIKSMDIETLRFNSYCIKNAFVVMDMPTEKTGDHAINGARNIGDMNNINFFDLNVDLKEEQYQYFTILGTDKLLMIKPISLIKTELK